MKPETIKLNRILCPIDFSAHSHAANFYASMFAEAAGAHIIFLSVDWPPSNEIPVGNRLDDLFSKLSAEIRPVSHEIDYLFEVRSGDPAAEILKYAKEHMIDLIVMGTHGYTGLNRLLHGSVCGQVLRHATCPVMAVKNASKSNLLLSEDQASA